jgi:hypothetical protein
MSTRPLPRQGTRLVLTAPLPRDASARQLLSYDTVQSATPLLAYQTGRAASTERRNARKTFRTEPSRASCSQMLLPHYEPLQQAPSPGHGESRFARCSRNSRQHGVCVWACPRQQPTQRMRTAASVLGHEPTAAASQLSRYCSQIWLCFRRGFTERLHKCALPLRLLIALPRRSKGTTTDLRASLKCAVACHIR